MTKRSVEPGHLSPHECETRARNSNAGFKIEAKCRADIGMVAWFKVKVTRRTPACDFNIVCFIGAIGRIYSGQIRQSGNQRFEFGASRPFALFQRRQCVFQLRDLCLQRLGSSGVAFAHGRANGFRRFVSAGLRILHFCKDRASVFIQSNNGCSNGGSAPSDQSSVKVFWIFSDIFQVMHGATLCRASRRFAMKKGERAGLVCTTLTPDLLPCPSPATKHMFGPTFTDLTHADNSADR